MAFDQWVLAAVSLLLIVALGFKVLLMWHERLYERELMKLIKKHLNDPAFDKETGL